MFEFLEILCGTVDSLSILGEIVAWVIDTLGFMARLEWDKRPLWLMLLLFVPPGVFVIWQCLQG